MWGSILAAVSSQIATTTDAIVVSNLIGPDAISAVNLVMPVLTIFSSLMILFGIGASVVAAKAIGRRDDREANGVFTSGVISCATIGVFLALITYVFSPSIVEVLGGGDERICGYALEYLQAMCLSLPLMMLAGVYENFAKTDGNPRIVMYAVLSGSVLNLVLDIVFVKYCGFGISGSAWATGINYLFALLICILHFRSPGCSIHWSNDKKLFMRHVRQSISQGFPMSINTLLLAVSIYAINSIVLHWQGVDGMYCWSVCMQIFLIMQMVLMGIGSGIYAIGGILAGEQDMEGMAILNRKSMTYICVTLAAVTAFILVAPDFVARLFGSKESETIGILPLALRAFSLLLVPYSVVAQLRALYQILGRTRLSLVLSISQLFLMVAFILGFSFISGGALWWGFPVSAYSMLAGLIIHTMIIHSRNKEITAVTLIPCQPRHEALNMSVRDNLESVEKAKEEISGFLTERGVDNLTCYEVRLSCEELLDNLVKYAVGKNPDDHFFDLHIRVNPKEINVLIKDDGRPFNPVISGEIAEDEINDSSRLGLKLVNWVTKSIDYKYMFDQNMVMLTFQRNIE